MPIGTSLTSHLTNDASSTSTSGLFASTTNCKEERDPQDLTQVDLLSIPPSLPPPSPTVLPSDVTFFTIDFDFYRHLLHPVSTTTSTYESSKRPATKFIDAKSTQSVVPKKSKLEPRPSSAPFQVDFLRWQNKLKHSFLKNGLEQTAGLSPTPTPHTPPPNQPEPSSKHGLIFENPSNKNHSLNNTTNL